MAVTQQLARVPAVYLATCRQSAGTSPDGDPHWDPPSANVLDLDWAPALLERVCELGGLDDVHRDALRQATEGSTVIDLGFLDMHPHAIAPVGPPPTALPKPKWPASRSCSDKYLQAVLAGCRPTTPRPLR